MARSLKPWSASLKKRQVKSPKIHIRDSGLLHRLLGAATFRELERYPKVDASWEGFVIENVIRALDVDERQCFFRATHGGAEIDLIVQQAGELRGFEVKRTTAPSFTPSMQAAFDDLGLRRIDAIHAGKESFPIAGEQSISVRNLAAGPLDLSVRRRLPPLAP